MSDKSPRHTMSKKSGKSIKEKRAEKRDKHHEQTQDQTQQQDPDAGRGTDGRKDPPPRATRRGLRTRARIPTSHHAKIMHELMAAVFLAVGVAVVGLLACCVVKCDGAYVACVGFACPSAGVDLMYMHISNHPHT